MPVLGEFRPMTTNLLILRKFTCVYRESGLVFQQKIKSYYTAVASHTEITWTGEQDLCRHPFETATIPTAQSYVPSWLVCLSFLSRHSPTQLTCMLKLTVLLDLSPPSIHVLILGPLSSLQFRPWVFPDSGLLLLV